jgi:hypothetical protein
MRTENMEPPDTDTDVHCPACRRVANGFTCKCGRVDRREADEAMTQAVQDSDFDLFAEAFWAVHGETISLASRHAIETKPAEFARRVIAEALRHAYTL